MVAPAPTSAGRRGPELQLAWQRVYTRPAPWLDLDLVCGVPGLQGTDTHDQYKNFWGTVYRSRIYFHWPVKTKSVSLSTFKKLTIYVRIDS
jgi:hypothetical protein